LLCLESLRHLDDPKKKMEIVIFDNGSADGTAARVRGVTANSGPMVGHTLTASGALGTSGHSGGGAAASRALGAEAEFMRE
jgi:hypothetical protein